jgi:large subunit ribosomal protein L15
MVKQRTKHFRCSKTHGRGSKKKGRGAGERGGRGKAGLHKHKYLAALKLEKKGIKVFGKHGFNLPKRSRERAINVGQLEQSFPSIQKINLTEFAYDKWLGAGKISNPIEVKVKKATNLAKRKIEERGGKVAEG